MRRLRVSKHQETRLVRRIKLRKDKPDYEYIPLEEDETLVRLRPEVMNQDGTFNDEPWAYTRKFEHLVRDDRLTHMLKADWQNSAGEAKTFRVFFVDESPNEEALEEFKKLTSQIASMQDGKFADRFGAMFIHPSSNAGIQPEDPKRIGLSIDHQDESNLLGYCMPFMRIIELHMPEPSTATAEQLNSFYGGLFTFAHESAGHGMDINDATTNRLVQIGQDTYRSVNLFADNGQLLAGDTDMLDVTAPTYFDIGHTALDRNGNPVERRLISELHDYALTHAIDATIIGERPTLYANTSNAEHLAEVAASVTTGIEIPFSHLGHNNVLYGDRTTDGQTPEFAAEYSPDVGSQEIYTEHVGGLSGSKPIEFADPARVAFSYTRPRFDPETRQRIVDAKSRRFPTPHELLRVIGRTRS